MISGGVPRPERLICKQTGEMKIPVVPGTAFGDKPADSEEINNSPQPSVSGIQAVSYTHLNVQVRIQLIISY